jgi:hypothetical protein
MCAHVQQIIMREQSALVYIRIVHDFFYSFTGTLMCFLFVRNHQQMANSGITAAIPRLLCFREHYNVISFMSGVEYIHSIAQTDKKRLRQIGATRGRHQRIFQIGSRFVLILFCAFRLVRCAHFCALL